MLAFGRSLPCLQVYGVSSSSSFPACEIRETATATCLAERGDNRAAALDADGVAGPQPAPHARRSRPRRAAARAGRPTSSGPATMPAAPTRSVAAGRSRRIAAARANPNTGYRHWNEATVEAGSAPASAAYAATEM